MKKLFMSKKIIIKSVMKLPIRVFEGERIGDAEEKELQ